MLDGVQIIPTRTPTLPPATHTNTWIVGEDRLTVIDPPSPWPQEQRALFEAIEDRLLLGETVERIVLTHHHHDHVSGVDALKRALGEPVPVLAHPLTAELLHGIVEVDGHLNEDQSFDAGGRTLRALHTPGHAPGHLVFLDLEQRWMIAGDMVAGVGTILLHPDEGDLADYLASLQRMQAERPVALLPSHGPVLHDPSSLLSMYVAHRHMRSAQTREALITHGAMTPAELVSYVYGDLDPRAVPFAALQLRTHLRWMQDHGLTRPADETRWEAA
ncbi:MAG: MBL fold metallo-hydrolase [Deltaproteobacteria bacterium]|nr:MAG: MBL fold metallo-hydrolase [Deltaproteobacteria bacterium]